ncbi:MAG: cache domain-containing protein, partial [Ghiorsea sp.]|nr:cache domain-containing protein [Ghiorsea sp.]
MKKAVLGLLNSRKMSIFSMLMLLITAIIIILSLISGWNTLNSFKKIALEENLSTLHIIAENKMDALNNYIDYYLEHAKALSTMQTTQRAVLAITHAFHTQGIDSTVYQYANLHYDRFFKQYLSSWSYYDIYLIDTQGNIVYSVKHESDFSTNLRTGPYKDTGLSQVFHQAKDFLQTSNSAFAYYQPSKASSAFVAAPIIEDGVMLGVIALQFNTQAFYDELNDITGIGKTGEIVTGQLYPDKILITTPFRHDAQASFQRTISLNSASALPLQEGAAGHTGSGILLDWRGEEVIAVWKYIPSLQWGLVVKVDTQEAFSFLHQAQRRYVGWATFAFLIFYIFTYHFTRRLTLPLRQLTKVATQISQNPDHKISQINEMNFPAPQTCTEEVNTLSQAFTHMLKRIQATQHELKKDVITLSSQNIALDYQVSEQVVRMQAVIEHATHGIMTISESGNILSLNPAVCSIFAYQEAELLGKNVQQMFTQPIAEIQAFQDNTESQGIRKSGEAFPLEIRFTEMYV